MSLEKAPYGLYSTAPMQKGLISKSAYLKYKNGHPWLTSSDIVNKALLPPRAGACLFGDTWWLHSPESFLRLRRLGPNQNKWMFTPRFNVLTNADQFVNYFGDWLSRHLIDTLQRKMRMLDKSEDLCLRWIFSENDFLPGLILDVFDSVIVAQINSAPIELFWVRMKPIIESAFQQVTSRNAKLFELRNSSVRKKEGLELIETELKIAPLSLNWNGLKTIMTPLGSQKTGAYFDQRDNHMATLKRAQNENYKSAWDLCCYQGGFALHLAKSGVRVIGVDQSQTALEIANQNAELNSITPQNFTTVRADVFEWLSEQAQQNKKADLIVLDPPSFVKSRQEIHSAKRGLIELNSLALKCLNPGGLLVSCICSHHISEKIFAEIINTAATNAARKIKIVEKLGPSSDHTPIKGFTEGHYLQCWMISV